MKRFLSAALIALALPAQAVEMGEDGLHKQPWFTHTFRDIGEDAADAKEQGKRLALIFEQRGCIYCKELHEKVLSREEVAKYISDNFVVVQYNLYGDEEVTDLDGESLTEKEAAQQWGVVFTPTIIFLDDEIEEGESVKDATVATLPGAFGPGTTTDMFSFVKDKVYETDEPFQRYHARMIEKRTNGTTD